MASAAVNIATIETTLSQLYAKLNSSMSQKDRSFTVAKIGELENSLEFWERRLARSNGTRPSVASIDLGGF